MLGATSKEFLMEAMSEFSFWQDLALSPPEIVRLRRSSSDISRISGSH